jgi:hypothetical protein
LTAWSTAGVLGPVLVNYIREFQIGRGVRPSDAYTFTMYVLVGLLAIGFVCNFAVRPVSEALFTTRAQETAPREPLAVAGAPVRVAVADVTVATSHWGLVAVAWSLVGVPLAWGVFKTLTLAAQMFR